MKKSKKIIYWIVTLWLSLGMVSTGVVQLMKLKEEVAVMEALGYPLYFLTLLGLWKLLGVVAVLVPGVPLVKEWAYAGFFFAMTGAIFSHIASSNYGFGNIFPPLLLLLLTILSWYFRPESRKLHSKGIQV